MAVHQTSPPLRAITRAEQAGDVPHVLVAPEALRVEAPVPLAIVTDADMLSCPPPPQDWVLPGLLPAGELMLLAGADGSGKSYLALELAVSVAYGLPWAGGLLSSPAQGGEVLLISGEDSADEISRRMHAIAAVMARVPGWQGYTPGRIHVIALDSQPLHLMVAHRQAATPTKTEHVDEVLQIMQQVQPRVLIVDPLIMFHGLAEGDPQHMDSFARLLIRMARSVSGCSIVAVHHAGQDAIRGGQDDHMLGRGSTALNSAARAVLTVRRPTQGEAAALEAEGSQPAYYRAVRGPKVSRSAELPVAWLVLDEKGVPTYLKEPPACLTKAGPNHRKGRGHLTVATRGVEGRRAQQGQRDREPEGDDGSLWGGDQA